MATDKPDPKIIDALTAYLTKVEQAPRTLDEELSKLIEFLITEKSKFLPKLSSSPVNQIFFNNELEKITSVRHTLRLMDEIIADTSLKADIWNAVIAAFVAGINLGQYTEPLSPVKTQLEILRTDHMRERKRKKRAPIINQRKELLKSQGYDLEALAKSRKQCEAIVTEFSKLCEANGIKAVGAQQLGIDAEDILNDRSENSVTS